MAGARVKRALLIVDGLGDLPVPQLDGQTPLEAASTPNLNSLAERGRYGPVDPISPGVIPNTDTGTSILMGMEPDDAHLLRRGPIEAAGAGYPLKPGEIALRANFATGNINGADWLVTDRRAGRADAGFDRLAKDIAEIDLDDGIRARYHPTDQHRGVVVMSGAALDEAVTDTDPGDARLPAPIALSQATRPEATLTAEKVNRYVKIVRDRLAGHPVNAERVASGLLPANCLITRGAGARLELRNRYLQLGHRVALVAGCNTVLGLGSQFDFDLFNKAGFTADTNSDFTGKITTAMNASHEYDVVIVHIKAPDTCAHDQDPVGKMQTIEKLDRALEPLHQWQGIFALSADHTTNSNTGRHTSDPVPSLLVHLNGDENTGASELNFSESLCRKGNLERQNSENFINKFLQK